jgi:hypothetical protein
MPGKKIIVAPIVGWFLVAPDDDDIDTPQDVWHFAWLDAFTSKRRALKFASDHGWPKPYRAVRGRIAVNSEKR